MGHHENTVFGECGYTFWLERINKHHSSLLHMGSMGQHSSGSNQQIQLHIINNGLATNFLAERIAYGSLLLDPF